MLKLSPEIKRQLEQRARKTRKKDEHMRLCVILARSEGVSLELIAQNQRISVESVRRYLSEYEKENKIDNDPKGGRDSKLNDEQSQELSDHLQKITYFRVKDICNYVEKTYTVKYSRTGMNKWLIKHGFVYKEPVKVPGKLKLELQEQFISFYQALKANLSKDSEIYFLDAFHPDYQSQAVSGWIKKGEIKTLPTTNKQTRLHYVGAINLENMHVIAREYETVRSEHVILFLKDLERSSKATKIYVISDNGRSNKSKEIEEYLKTSKIEICYLPPYSPNLNPIERLWKIVRESITYNRYYESFSIFQDAIRKFFSKDIFEIGDILKQRINDRFQVIKLNRVQMASP
jgi:transposase